MLARLYFKKKTSTEVNAKIVNNIKNNRISAYQDTDVAWKIS